VCEGALLEPKVDPRKVDAQFQLFDTARETSVANANGEREAKLLVLVFFLLEARRVPPLTE